MWTPVTAPNSTMRRRRRPGGSDGVQPVVSLVLGDGARPPPESERTTAGRHAAVWASGRETPGRPSAQPARGPRPHLDWNR